ncbi:MAG: biotin/lipoyl-binding protein [Ruminococcaceae bacterium]|nr:biotin/lipoyl-binding protein [Oscillospiraceae bacterium]
MRKFMINVNGKSYEVEVEEVGGVVSAPVYTAPVQTSAPSPAPAAASTPAPAPAQTPAPAGATVVKSPMPGTIVAVKVNVGDMVKAGDVVCILEAMKMENEIMAPSDGKVVAINANQGTSVNTGDALVSLG